MLGHKVSQVVSQRYETHVTARRPFDAGAAGSVEARHWHSGVDVANLDRLAAIVRAVSPAVIVNCVGVIKQRPEAYDPLVSIEVNALFPHRLHQLAQDTGAYLIHLSTDCVFSGARGHYSEADLPDPPDLYGRSKLLGEIDAPDALTLRTSIIGHELDSCFGLVEWFLSQSGGSVRGFAGAIFSGFPTLVLARIIADLIELTPRLSGLYHVAAAPISKYELLLLLRDAYNVPVTIDRDERVRIDRSLNADRFLTATGLVAPAWPDMIARMAADSAIYAPGRVEQHEPQ
jgi:dTDP-4-dehydrorhamnose reductase